MLYAPTCIPKAEMGFMPCGFKRRKCDRGWEVHLFNFQSRVFGHFFHSLAPAQGCHVNKWPNRNRSVAFDVKTCAV